MKGDGMRQRTWRWIALGAVLTLALAACSDVDEPEADGAPTGGADGETTTEAAQCGSEPITIAVNPWTGAAVNANVAKTIMEQEMGCTVELVDMDEFAQFPALAQGDVDATLEVWPSGHAKDYKQYIEGEAGVVDGGELGVIGNIGWFTPTYVIDENPDAASWETLKGNEDIYDNTFLGADPTFSIFDEEIIENLGLDMEVTYSGSEAASLAALDQAYQNEEPILMYFWSPHWAQAKYELSEVELPPYDEKCAEAATNKDGDGYACDYAEDILYKAFSDELETKDPAAFEFLSNMSYTNEDQNEIALAVDDGGESLEDASQAWVDENEDVWSQWLPAA
jgi:glycine betaine/proline transport system substrate-binding protein